MFGQTATMLHALTFAQFDSRLAIMGMLVFILFLLIGVTPLAYVIGSYWAEVIKLRLKGAQAAGDRAQDADDRAGYDRGRDRPGPRPTSGALDDLSKEKDDEAGDVSGPYAGEVVIEREGYEGQWHSALVLRRRGDRYLVHTCPGYEGCELPGNEWVKADRIRFPASSSGQDVSPDACEWCAQPEKEPVPAEV